MVNVMVGWAKKRAWIENVDGKGSGRRDEVCSGVKWEE